VIYLDSCAIVKLIRPEDESVPLSDWLNDQGDAVVVTTELAEVEVARALRRNSPARLAAMPNVLAQINRIEMDASVRATAAAYVDPLLRSLDAIHLATADTLVASGKPVSAFVTYDRRLASAAVELGLSVAAPRA
jgi:predicted nucleic acid-binding protein